MTEDDLKRVINIYVEEHTSVTDKSKLNINDSLYLFIIMLLVMMVCLIIWARNIVVFTPRDEHSQGASSQFSGVDDDLIIIKKYYRKGTTYTGLLRCSNMVSFEQGTYNE